MPGTLLGTASDRSVLLDANAAGYGWYIDPTPLDDREFISGVRLSAADAGLRMDLLTAVMHELGHVLGRGHTDDFEAMFETLATGARRSLLAP